VREPATPRSGTNWLSGSLFAMDAECPTPR
jgi:hypothetical protein